MASNKLCNRKSNLNNNKISKSCFILLFSFCLSVFGNSYSILLENVVIHIIFCWKNQKRNIKVHRVVQRVFVGEVFRFSERYPGFKSHENLRIFERYQI